MSEDVSYIYQIKNKVNGKFYVGSAHDYRKRWYQHEHALNSNCHGNQHLQNAWNKYGRENFEFSILEVVPFELQFIKEQEYLNKLNPFDNDGYNLNKLAYKGAESPHCIIKICVDCGTKFKTYYDSAIRCEKCRENLHMEYTNPNDCDCLHCQDCELKSICDDDIERSPIVCDKYLNCDKCDLHKSCAMLRISQKEMDGLNKCANECISAGYGSTDAFWECNGI